MGNDQPLLRCRSLMAGDDLALMLHHLGFTEYPAIDEPLENPKARAIAFSLRDPDGYALTISQ